MFAFPKTKFGFATLAWLSLALAVSCLSLILSMPFSLAGTTGVTLEERLTSSASDPKTVLKSAALPASTASASADSDNDGFPDQAELGTFIGRENFRHAFTSIAEIQFYRLSEHWNSEQRDCAGLVRFAWREALRRHDRAWFQKMGPAFEAIAPSVGVAESALGDKLFRTDFGVYKESDFAQAKFSEFADARTLKNFNTAFVSRDRHLAQPGDLLFYYQPWVQKFPYHVMIFLGESRVAASSSRDWVVYHTGASPTDPGTVKKVEMSVLDHHPNKRWRPVESNPNFLGFYRLKILD